MALIKLGGLAQDVRGSLNGTTFSRNKGGAYVRTKVSPVQPRSPAQLRQRLIFGNNAKAWSTLTDTQRAAWLSFAQANPLVNVFGDSIIISGLAAYQQLNSVLGTIAMPLISDPPTDKSVIPLVPLDNLIASASTGFVQVSTLTQTTVPTSQWYVFATPNLQPGITPNKTFYRFVGSYVSMATSTTFDLTSNWQAIFGVPIAGKKIWAIVATVNTDTGALLPGTKLSVTVS